jgi:hypothetical protein
MLIGDPLERPASHRGRQTVPVRLHDDVWTSNRRWFARWLDRLGADMGAHAGPRRIDTVVELLVSAVVLVISAALIAVSIYLSGTVMSWTRSEDVAAEALALRDVAVESGVSCDGWVPGSTDVVLGVMNSADGRCIVQGTGVALRFEAFVRSYLDGDNQAGFPPGATGECPWLDGPGFLVAPVMAERTERQQWATATSSVRSEIMGDVQAALGGTLHPC